jgi:sodium transport system permease protein
MMSGQNMLPTNDLSESADDTTLSFSSAQQWEFTKKELRETLRDRRTIVTLLAMPLLLYPLLGLGFRFLTFQRLSAEQPRHTLVFDSEPEALWLMQQLERSAPLPTEQISVALPEVSTAGTLTVPQLEFLVSDRADGRDLEQLISGGAADLGIRVTFLGPQNQGSGLPPPVSVELLESSGSLASRSAAEYIERRLNQINASQVTQWARLTHQEFQLPISQERTLVGSSDAGASLLGLLPLILLLMTVTGGVYPAIDLTAGERERNTLETLISLPVPKFRLLLAKYVAVVTVTMLTGLMNLVAMTVTLYSLQLDTFLIGSGGLTLSLAIKLLIALLAFALFYSAVLLTLTSSARSFKEAQAYLIPLLLLSIGPGLVIMIPGWNLDRVTAVAPLINILLLSRDLLEGTARLLPTLVAIISTIFYGTAALALAAQVFASDAVAVGSRGRWSDLLSRASGRQLPTTSMAFVALAILFPAYFVSSGLLSRGEDITPSYRLIVSASLTAILFLGLPVLLLRWSKIPLRWGLALHAPPVPSMLGALLLGMATWPLVFEMIVALHSMGIRGPDLSSFEQVEQLLAGWRQVPLWLIILALGLAPGICEESFFRGFFYNGVRQHLGDRSTILITAVIFGLFHVVLAGGAAPERLIPSTLMGLLLGWLRYRSGSLIPGIFLHTIHNSSLLVLAQYRDELAGWGLSSTPHESHLPIMWVFTAAVGFILGVGCVTLFGKHGSKQTPESLSENH